jgi:UDP:flavonoid glycosyltransferase YjiC (YdhE family)
MKFVLAAYGSRGDVEPCAAVGRELLRRGHEVHVAAPPDMLGFVESAGLPAVAYGADTREQLNAAANFVHKVENPMGALHQVMEQLNRTWAAKTATLTALADGADLLLAGMNEQELAANVAQYHGIPLAALHFFPAQIITSGLLYSSMMLDAANAQRRGLGLAEVAEAPAASLEIQGYEEFCLPGLAASWGDAAARRPFVGALTLESPTDYDEEVSSWIAAGTPPICFGFGSTPIGSPPDMLAMIGAACAQLGERALISSGANDFSGGPHVEHVKVVPALNHAAVLPACRAVVHHGGAGATAASMRAGIPSLLLWIWLDQPVWAAAVERLETGIGRQFSTATQDTLVADLHRILTPRYAARARELAAQMTPGAESTAKAADLLEGLASRA